MDRPRLAIIGVGLIGGSFARALRRADAVGDIVGCGRQVENLERAVQLGVIDEATQDAAEAVDGAGIVMISVPVESTESLVRAIARSVAPGAVVTDAGSTKRSVIAAVQRACGEVPPWFVPGHPIAGTEHSGVDASFAELYDGRRVILTPLPETPTAAVERVSALWQACGARVDCMPADHHDELLAATSHLPHMLAYQLVAMLAGMDEKREIFSYAAGGFRDFTRIASSSPDMWHDIAHANKDALVPMMAAFRESLARLEAAIRDDDREAVLQCFREAKAARDRYTAEEGRRVPRGDLE